MSGEAHGKTMNELRTRKVRDIIATENNLLGLRPGDSILGVKSFEPMSHFIGTLSMIVRVILVLNRTVIDSD